MWKRNSEVIDIHTDYIIDKKEKLGDKDRPSCVDYPSNYITLPE